MLRECPQCKNKFLALGTHWRYNPDHRPILSDKQRDIITGLMMGDGSLDKNSKNPILAVEMTNKEYLEELDNIFGCISTGVRLKNKAEEVARRSQHLGLKGSSANPSNYSDKYRIRTSAMPELREWDWYTENGKTWPEDIKLNPTVLKHWYVGDGSLNDNGSRFYLEIHLTNERENKKKVEEYFKEINIPIDRWRDDERREGGYKTSIIFNKDKAERLLEYMGDSLPGFNYKW